MYFIVEFKLFLPSGGVKVLSYVTQRLGNCVVCGERIYSDQKYVKSADGYCCEECINDEESVVAA